MGRGEDLEGLDYKFFIQMIIYIGGLGVFYGTLKTELKYMKEKLDKHNSFQDRLVIVEQKSETIGEKLEYVREEQKEIWSKLDEK